MHGRDARGTGAGDGVLAGFDDGAADSFEVGGDWRVNDNVLSPKKQKVKKSVKLDLAQLSGSSRLRLVTLNSGVF